MELPAGYLARYFVKSVLKLRDADVKPGALGLIGLEFQATLVFIDDLAADRQSQPGAMGFSFGHEGFE